MIQTLEEIRELAWSVRDISTERSMQKVAEEIRNGEKIEYFKSQDGKIWYITEASRRWDAKIKEWEMKQKRKKH